MAKKQSVQRDLAQMTAKAANKGLYGALGMAWPYLVTPCDYVGHAELWVYYGEDKQEQWPSACSMFICERHYG